MARRMLLVPVDGDVSLVDVGTGLDGMRKAIGADWIERVRVGEDWALAVDEEGRLSDKQVNRRASALYGYRYHGTPIMGDVLLGREGFVGDGVDWLDVDESVIQWFTDTLLKRDQPGWNPSEVD